MFPDSAIAKYFICGRTKATAILKVIAQDAGEALKQLSGILSISAFKQMILTFMFILYNNYASFFVLRIS